jgi:hypothetical protein
MFCRVGVGAWLDLAGLSSQVRLGGMDGFAETVDDVRESRFNGQTWRLRSCAGMSGSQVPREGGELPGDAVYALGSDPWERVRLQRQSCGPSRPGARHG